MTADSRRLFFALWPPPAVRRNLAAQAEACGIDGRRVPPERLHLTLAFLGNVGESRIECLCAGARAVAEPPFRLELSRIGYFPRPAPVWIGPLRTPAALAGLAEAVRRCAAEAGIGLQARRFRPHVTLARRADKPKRPRVARPVDWPVHDFALTESLTVDGTAVYRNLQRWPLVLV